MNSPRHIDAADEAQIVDAIDKWVERDLRSIAILDAAADPRRGDSFFG